MVTRRNQGITYRSSGVDIDSMEEAIRKIRGMARTTFGPQVLSGIGGFGGLFRPALDSFREPVLVASTDGVGTKLKVAARMGIYRSIGRDLVSHCVNDILCQGATPLFFLDYVAMGKLEAKVVQDVVHGVAESCREFGCALLGGETSEMPGVYGPGEFDLVGFIVGIVDRAGLIDGSGIAPGDCLIGLPASGLHTNGYSLARKLFFELLGWGLEKQPPNLERTIGEELLITHRGYLAPIRPILPRGWISGMAHITGGGIPDNLPRVLPEGCRAEVVRGSWPVLPIFTLIQETGKVEEEEMYRTFNMGIGMILIAAPDPAERILSELGRSGHPAYRIGRVREGPRGVVFRDRE